MVNIMIGSFGTTVVPGSRQKLIGTTNKGVSSSFVQQKKKKLFFLSTVQYISSTNPTELS
jgi:hypothetical protein